MDTDNTELLVLSFPAFASTDLEKIQTIRRRLDAETAAYLPPHFTHLLPLDYSWERTILSAAQATSGIYKPFDFSIKTVTILDDPETGENFLVLVPEKNESLLHIHFKIYEKMALPPPFGSDWQPHITLGLSTDRESLIAEAKQIKPEIAGLTGTINSIAVVASQPGEIKTIKSFVLGE